MLVLIRGLALMIPTAESFLLTRAHAQGVNGNTLQALKDGLDCILSPLMGLTIDYHVPL